ncbi:MAG: MbnH family di-heme enzyme [Gemmatimonadota bacterium]
MRECRRGHGWKIRTLSTAIACLAAACSSPSVVGTDPTADPPFSFSVPAGFPTPVVPADNQMSSAKVELGRRLFYDVRLSQNRTQSCGSCHKQALAFTDGRMTGLGSTGESHPRNSMSVVNMAYAAALTWANPQEVQLELQAAVPLFGQHPVELGFTALDDAVAIRLAAEAEYRTRFGVAFPGQSNNGINVDNITRAIAAFERTLISGGSAFDKGTMSASAIRGEQLFRSPQLACATCHGGFTFSGATSQPPPGAPPTEFFNNGLYNLGGTGAYPADNTGLVAVTGVVQDMGRFKAPTLRNIALTAPYMHDGSVATLDEVLDIYARGGRLIATGPNAGDGRNNPFKSNRVNGFVLGTQQRADLLAFLNALTDSDFVGNTLFSNPWPKGSAANP